MRTDHRWIAAIAFLAGLPCAWAQGGAYCSTAARSHGGQIGAAGPYCLELVVGQEELTVYLTDHDNGPVDATGGSAKAIITSGKKRRYVVVLKPAGANALRGAGEFTLGRSNVVSVMVVLPDGKPQRAKFTLQGPRGKKGKKTRTKPR